MVPSCGICADWKMSRHCSGIFLNLRNIKLYTYTEETT